MIQRSDLVNVIKGVGEKTVPLFAKCGIRTVDDLLHYYPRTYIRYPKRVTVSEATPGVKVAFEAVVRADYHESMGKRLKIETVSVYDSTGLVRLKFFNRPYLRSILKKGNIFTFCGIIKETMGSYTMEQPSFFKSSDYDKREGRLLPIYPLTKDLGNQMLMKAVSNALKECAPVTSEIKEQTVSRFHLLSEQEAISTIHFPGSDELVVKARERLVFDEFYFFLCNLVKLQSENNRKISPYRMIETAECVRFRERLPFTLTQAQQKAYDEIRQDLCGEYEMNRMVLGDVGSGKTMIAILAILLCVTNGYQAAFMVPTEVLAKQHYEEIMRWTRQFSLAIKPVLLTGSLTAKDRKTIYSMIANGEANTIIGTHALIQEKVAYQRLALAITDEEHRFGVKQKDSLATKGQDVHTLVMSATPIPRTLAMILYGDLTVSEIKQMPSNRKRIKNCVISEDDHEKAYRFLLNQIQNGRQAYVICPLANEEEEETELKDVVSYRQKLMEWFPDEIRISYLHGKLKPAEKNKIMEQFAEGGTDILVATTVIEVGINVPNATVIMIENAERFGLAQLHQLRGRVGRGNEQSYCIFINASHEENAGQRLDILNHCNDGFEISQKDLELRGSGDLFGVRQSGQMSFILGDIYQDSAILQMAYEAAKEECEQYDTGMGIR